ASTWPSLPRRRTLRALDFITVLPSVTWPSPATTTWPLRRTETMVVAWKTLGLRLGSMRPPGPNPVEGGRFRLTQPPRHRRPGRHDGVGRGYAPDDSSRESRALLFRPEKPSGT